MVQLLHCIILITLNNCGVGFLFPTVLYSTLQKPFISSTKRYTSTDTKSSDAANFENSGTKTRDISYEENLYEVLGVAPNATKAEMRRKYVNLARSTHPDALIGKKDNGVGDPGAEFSKIARAYEVLSNKKDRKRYDRSLVAKDFTENVEKAATAASETVGPRVKKVLDDFAVPFLKRTTATTVAGVSAAVDTLSEGSGLDFGSAVFSAFKAGERVNKLLDGELLRDESVELKGQAKEEEKKASDIQGKIKNITQTRLTLSLRTKNSGLSSTDALELLGAWNSTEESMRMIDRLSLRQTVEEEINELEKTETVYYECVAEQEEAVKQFRFTQNALKNSAKEAQDAMEEEIAARKALENAQKRVLSSSQNIDEIKKSFAKITNVEQKATQEVEAALIVLRKKQEKVRKALVRKEDTMSANITLVNAEGENGTKVEPGKLKPSIQDNNARTFEEIKELQKQERFLEAERKRREERAAKFFLQARRLLAQADEIDLMKNSGK
mmetsp:Transcript_26808/g.30640  ORF Transcript_26808/g.30640 Transcript_26808/m.30640 type:complete len:499 (+) Transcript_26808:26-1522(+)|eukprot:CAMPEP_0194183590 /NCGR_PEP_ID=MMETSP0154-20130528/32574_1 /TAXON_ID=1049557 /ORGANISM="Thalassiothrix antarctica, Strain L6-D1" /LENGTH=498 /DNA_ID=CAMNT_0038900627 /DNA_START=21 /DNA_END=1517 /DNA_ORIENTATION=+